MRKVPPWLWYTLGGAAALFIFGERKTIMLYGRQLVDSAHDGLFTSLLPDYAQPYAGVMLLVSRNEGIDPFLIFALGDRESLWGTSDQLDQQGPGGRGDGGHGHGLMQLDDRDADNAAIIASGAWAIPLNNVTFGIQKLKKKMRFFETRYASGTVTLTQTQASRRKVAAGTYPDPRPLTGSDLWIAAIAAYNTGEGNVLWNLAAGKPAEYTTADGDYATDVSARATAVATQYDQALV